VPARRTGPSIVVANLRPQPVEIHHGEEVVVLPPYEQARLPDVPGSKQLTELASRGLVSVQEVEQPKAAQTRRPARRRAKAKASAPAGAARRRKRTRPKSKTPPKEGS
jgi:hypothetical protein